MSARARRVLGLDNPQESTSSTLDVPYSKPLVLQNDNRYSIAPVNSLPISNLITNSEPEIIEGEWREITTPKPTGFRFPPARPPLTQDEIPAFLYRRNEVSASKLGNDNQISQPITSDPSLPHFPTLDSGETAKVVITYEDNEIHVGPYSIREQRNGLTVITRDGGTATGTYHDMVRDDNANFHVSNGGRVRVSGEKLETPFGVRKTSVVEISATGPNPYASVDTGTYGTIAMAGSGFAEIHSNCEGGITDVGFDINKIGDRIILDGRKFVITGRVPKNQGFLGRLVNSWKTIGWLTDSRGDLIPYYGRTIKD